jgi:acid phosphatase
MQVNKRTAQTRLWMLSSVGSLTFGLAIGSFGIIRSDAVQSPQTAATAVNPQERGIDANLYMQTSAEYAAVCLQTYNWALERLKQKLAATKNGDLRPAVVMDLDETVIDNSGYQSFLFKAKSQSTAQNWEVWEKSYPQEARLVPGARSFIEAAEQMGVAVVYISNRSTKNQDAAIAAIKHVGLNTEEISNRLLLRDNTSDKSPRRKIAEGRFNALMYFGDNLRDFSEEFVAPNLDANDDAGQKRAIAERFAKVQRANYRWGNDWIVLPNPAYGEWTRLIGNDPAKKFRPTEMKIP